MTDAPLALRRTSLFDQHCALGARLVPFAGWEMAIQYTGVVDEHRAVRTAAGLFDVSHMGEFVLTGEHAASVIDYLTTNNASRLGNGEAIYTLLCNEGGTILDDLIVYRIADERWMVVCNASNHEKVRRHLTSACEHHCDLEDVSARTALLALQGPKAADILRRGGESALACTNLRAFQSRDALLDGHPATVARTGYTGEDGFEIFCPWDQAPAIWKFLMKLGVEDGLQAIGLGARDTLRLEARLSLYGNELDETTDPLEAGLGWAVKLGKGDFVGRTAIEARRQAGPRRQLVGLQMTGRGIARQGYPIKTPAGEIVGQCTSGSSSPTLGINIGLGYVPPALTAIGTPLLIDCRGRDISAVVVKTPFYKRPAVALGLFTDLFSKFSKTPIVSCFSLYSLFPFRRCDFPWPSPTSATSINIRKTTNGSARRAAKSDLLA